MAYFQKISRKNGEKLWKKQGTNKCTYCGKVIDEKENHFTLIAYWKIKNRSDVKHFCSFKCLEKWIKSVK